jgi:hypothetical protein
MDGRTIYRTLSLKRVPFQTGIDWWSHLRKVPKEDKSATHILCDCQAIAYLKFRHLDQFFVETSDYYDAPINKVIHFIRDVGLIKD